MAASIFSDPWMEKTSSFSTPKNYFHDMIVPYGGSGFSLKPSPFKGVTDFAATGRGGFRDFQGGQRNSKGEVDENGQIVQRGQSGAAMKNYKLQMADLAYLKRERDMSGSSSLSSRNLLDEPPKKKSRRLVDDRDFPEVAFADGRSKASVSIQDLGFDLTDMPQEKEMLATKGFHTNGSITGEMVRVVPVPGCDPPGEYDFVIASKAPFINGFDSNLDPHTHTIDNEREEAILGDYSQITYPRTNGLTFPMFNGDAGFPALPRRGMTIASFNYYIAGIQTYSSTDKTEDGDIQRKSDFMKHFRYIQAFAIHGTADSEKYSNNGSSFGMNRRTSDLLSSPSALNDKDLNILYEGRAQIKNIFGPAPAGTKLWLIWKKIPRPEKYLTIKATDPLQSLHNPGVSNALKWENSQLSSHPFQLVPYADIVHAEPPLSEVEFASDHIREPGVVRRKHMGICFYVGEVLKPQEAFSNNGRVDHITRQNLQKRAIYDITTGQQDLIEILVQVKQAGLGTMTRLPTFPLSYGTKPQIAKMITDVYVEQPSRNKKEKYEDV